MCVVYTQTKRRFTADTTAETTADSFEDETAVLIHMSSLKMKQLSVSTELYLGVYIENISHAIFKILGNPVSVFSLVSFVFGNCLQSQGIDSGVNCNCCHECRYQNDL